MELPQTLRDDLVVELDDYLEALDENVDPEALAAYVIELLEAWADDEGFDDIVGTLEDEGALEGTLQQSLEDELASNDELEFTGEEVVSLLETVCGIDWELDEDDEDLDDEDEEDDEDEDLEEEA